MSLINDISSWWKSIPDDSNPTPQTSTQTAIAESLPEPAALPPAPPAPIPAPVDTVKADFDGLFASAVDMAHLSEPPKVAPLPCEPAAIITDEIRALAKEFKVISLAFMTKTYFDERFQENGKPDLLLPVYAAVDVNFGHVRGRYWRVDSGAISPSDFNPALPPTSEGMFGMTQAFHFRFQGTIPDDVRSIYAANKDRFDRVLLICDAKDKWSLETVYDKNGKPVPFNPDPLMVGVKRLANGKNLCFLLAKFDLTKSEMWAMDEFAI